MFSRLLACVVTNKQQAATSEKLALLYSAPLSIGLRCPYAVGLMLGLSRKKFVGSYVFLSLTSRSYLAAP